MAFQQTLGNPSLPNSFSSNSSVSEPRSFVDLDPWASLTFEEVKTAFVFYPYTSIEI
jgi:hypothetical protein